MRARRFGTLSALPWFVESIIHEARRALAGRGRLVRWRPRLFPFLVTDPADIELNTDASPSRIFWPDPRREAAFEAWLAGIAPSHALRPSTLRPASSDASFRRYFRIDLEADAGAGAGARASRIVMDAPPPLEDVRPFVHVAGLLEAAGLNVPAVLESDVDAGFLLLGDLGSVPMLGALQGAVARGDPKAADALMRSAIGALVRWQRHGDAAALPPCDAVLLQRELNLFPTWCVAREHGVTWNDAETATWRGACTLLVESALQQPSVAMHRDYMPRNLMVCGSGPAGLGILDFQDAVRGPITYDIASLLRDAFISWDEPDEIDWAVRYWQAARAEGLPVGDDFGEFWRQLEWMGLQRHLKVLGIFCRLKHRDAKPAYSADLPRFFAYAHKTASRYNALRPLARLLEPLMGAERIDAYR